jgi:aminodeoxychorismate synthase, component I, bacterial clade
MKHPRVVELPYQEDGATFFEALVDFPWSVFLDSGPPDARRGRFDVLTARPYITLSTRDRFTEIHAASGSRQSSEDPFTLLREHLGPAASALAGLPFGGGALGYFAYDLGRRIERLPIRAADDLRLPEMAIGFYDWAVVVDHRRRRAYLVGHGRDAETFAEWEHLIRRLSCLPQACPPQARRRPLFMVLSEVRTNMDRQRYGHAFARVKHYIREGDCYQVNLAQRFSVQVEGDPWEGYRRLRTFNPAPFGAFLNTPYGAVLSTSPERFLKVRRGRVETKPIKGTRPRSEDPRRDRALAEALLSSSKDRAENLMIVDLLRNDLGKTCALGSVRVPRLFALESFATVHHLVSTITGRLDRGKHGVDLLRGCFPGGSITGAPKLRAMEIIEELEPHRRGVYCGAIGYIAFDGSMDTNIAIRTAVCVGGHFYFWAGGGLVWDSREEDEFNEIYDKAAAMLRFVKGWEMDHVGRQGGG